MKVEFLPARRYICAVLAGPMTVHFSVTGRYFIETYELIELDFGVGFPQLISP